MPRLQTLGMLNAVDFCVTAGGRKKTTIIWERSYVAFFGLPSLAEG
ncbi:MAG: hypothetical protein ACQXXH_04865 [Candidatus Bathyarchaeia archaeon]|nr:hypothetical protein [Candidatus Bathyarchaeota archaeon A05DMB-4]MDH7595065.1 hypothetical protein [Candidatus Bathyarchaeota archaeon]